MTEAPRETRVLDAVVTLVDSLLDDFDVVDLLTELTERCAQLLDVDSAGLLLADPLEQLRVLAATTEIRDQFVIGERVRVDRLQLAVRLDRGRLERLVPLA